MIWKRLLLLCSFAIAACSANPETPDDNPPEPEVRVSPDPNPQQLKQYCEEGNAGACLDLGIRYERGEQGVEENPGEAFEYYEKACRLGSSHGCYSEALVLLYDQDNPIRALPLLEYTCERAEHWPSCVTLGDLHRTGAVFPEDEKKALTMYGMACEGGYHRGCNAYIRHLWTASEQLIGLQDFAEFLERQCERGHEMSCREAADLYATGAKWTGEKLEQDDETAAEFRARLALARRQRIEVDEIQEPPPTEMKRRNVAPEQPPPPPFKPGYIVVETPKNMHIIVDGVDTGEKTPGTVELLKGGRHTVRLRSENGEFTDEKVTWLSSGDRVELMWDRSGSEIDEPDSAEKEEGEEDPEEKEE